MPGVRIVDEARFFATVMPGKWIGVCRLDFAPGDAAAVLGEVRSLEPGVSTSWQTPRADLADALREAGCRDPRATHAELSQYLSAFTSSHRRARDRA